MMATVFFMQPLGQIAGNLISLVVISISRRSNNDDLLRSVDIMWRWIIGIGVVPGVVALLFRFAIPETPRFLLDIEDDPIKAEFDATQLFGDSSMGSEMESGAWCDSFEESHLSSRSIDQESEGRPSWTIAGTPMTTLNSSWRLSKADIKQYFWIEGNWKTLAATSMCWLLLDFGYYGIGLSSPQFLAKTWGSLDIAGPSPPWMTNDDPKANIYDMFLDNSVQALVILNTGSFAGGLLWIAASNRLNRVSVQKYGFLVLAALFIALGTVFITIHQEGALAITLYVIGQMAFNLGTLMTCFVYISLAATSPLTLFRPEFDDIHYSRRALPDPIPRDMPRHQRRLGQTGIHPRANLFRILQIRLLVTGGRPDQALRHDSGHLQRVHDPRSRYYALLDSRRAREGQEGLPLGRQGEDAGRAGTRQMGCEKSVGGQISSDQEYLSRQGFSGRYCIDCHGEQEFMIERLFHGLPFVAGWPLEGDMEVKQGWKPMNWDTMPIDAILYVVL